MSYIVRHKEYNLTVFTVITTQDSETYNSSFTIIRYTSTNKSILSIEVVEFNSPVTLSQLYAILGRVAREIGKIYERSRNKTLTQLAKGYYIMGEEVKHLSNLIRNQLHQYDKIILENRAILMDDWFTCTVCTGIVGIICGLLAQGVAQWAACHVVCSLTCTALIFGPWLSATCFIICGTICNSVLYWMLYIGIGTACFIVGSWVCGQAGWCP